MEKEVNNAEKEKGILGLKIVLGVLVVCIIGLIVGIIMIVTREPNEEDLVEGDEWIEMVDDLEGRFMEEYEAEGIEAARAVYQKYIEDEENGEQYIVLRIGMMESVCGANCAKYILEDVEMLDPEKNNSRAFAYRCEYMGKYGNSAEAEVYCEKARKLVEEGIAEGGDRG